MANYYSSKNIVVENFINAYTIVAHDHKIYIADGTPDPMNTRKYNVYLYDLHNKSIKGIARSIFPPSSMGITKDGKRLIMCGDNNDDVATFDIDIHSLSTYNNIGTFNIRKCRGNLHVVDYFNFFVGNELNRNVAKIILNGSSFVVQNWTQSFTTVVPKGIACAHDHLFVCDANNGTIVKVPVKATTDTVPATIIYPDGKRLNHPTDIVWDKKHRILIVADDDGIKTFKISGSRLILKKLHKTPTKPMALTLAKDENRLIYSRRDHFIPTDVIFDVISKMHI